MKPSHREQQTDLRAYLAMFRRRKWTIAVMLIVVEAAALAMAVRQVPLYTAQARLLVKPIGSNPTAQAFPQPIILETEQQIVASVPVAEEAKKQLDTDRSPEELLGGLSVGGVTATSVLTIAYTSPDPFLAQRGADAFAQGYIDHRRNTALKDLLAAQQTIQKRIEQTSEQLNHVNEQYREAVAQEDTTLIPLLETQRNILLGRIAILQQRIDELQPDRSVQLGAGEIIQPAALPTAPSSPDYAKTAVLAAFFGLALGGGLAFLRERLDDRFREPSDAEFALAAPILASVPPYGGPRKGRYLIVSEEPQSIGAESYRSLRTNLEFTVSQRDIRSVLVTSPSPGEGKTVTVANLALTFAQAGRRTILISADLRRPTLDDYFNVRGEEGLSTWLAGRTTGIPELLEDATMPNLKLLPSGTIPPNPAELLASGRLQELIAALESACDILLIDSAPVLPVTDASAIASRTGGTLLVIDAETTHRSAALRARGELDKVGANVLGIILNRFNPSDSSYYGGGYEYTPIDDRRSSGGRSRRPRKQTEVAG